jgi:deoxyribodipyrimidine photo-lyase
MNTAIWFTNDLRIFDNKAFVAATEQGFPVLAFFLRPEFGSKQYFQFQNECLEDLDRDLKTLGVPLYVFESNELSDLITFVLQGDIGFVFSSKAFNSRKRAQQIELEHQLKGVNFKYACSETLLDQTLLDIRPENLDDTFTVFRKKIESRWLVPSLVASPKPQQEIPSMLNDFSRFLFKNKSLKSEPSKFFGGRAQGLKRLSYYLSESQKILTYKETRNGLTSFDDSSKFSPWLAHGCVSAREIYWAIKKFEQQVRSNESTYWLVFELLWRDYFKFLAEKYQDKFFSLSGLRRNKLPLSFGSEDDFENWKKGTTQSDFINANMIELAQTGWMSNRGRQNVANYLVKTLGVEWVKGADYFEKTLIDYDCESNWGNWLYQSGRGTDPRDRIFDPEVQARNYDRDRSYRDKWLKKWGGHE